LRGFAAERDGFFAALRPVDPEIFRRANDPLSTLTLWRSASIRLTALPETALNEF
jgi:hypothetical protein